MIEIGKIPFDKLKIGDRVISCTGCPGIIVELYPIGTVDSFGYNWDDWAGGMKILWRTHGPKEKYSTTGWNDLKIIYVGEKR